MKQLIGFTVHSHQLLQNSLNLNVSKSSLTTRPDNIYCTFSHINMMPVLLCSCFWRCVYSLTHTHMLGMSRPEDCGGVCVCVPPHSELCLHPGISHELCRVVVFYSAVCGEANRETAESDFMNTHFPQFINCVVCVSEELVRPLQSQ